MVGNTVEDKQNLVDRRHAYQRYTEPLEVVESPEIGSIVLAHFKNGLSFAFEGNGVKQVFATDGNAVGYRQQGRGAAAKKNLCMFENPRIAYGPAAYQYAVDAV